MTEPTPAPTGLTDEQYRAALAVFGQAGTSTADATTALTQLLGINAAQLRPARIAEQQHVCHRCQAPATAQWQRYATADEAEAWHAGREQHIRAHNDGRAAAEYVSDRSGVVTMAVHGCDEHDLSPGPVDDANAAGYEARQIGADRRALIHDAECGGHGACGCGCA